MQFFGIPGFQTLQRIGQHLATVLQTNIWITLLQCYTSRFQTLQRIRSSFLIHHLCSWPSSYPSCNYLEHQVFNCYKPPTWRADKCQGMGGPGGSWCNVTFYFCSNLSTWSSTMLEVLRCLTMSMQRASCQDALLLHFFGWLTMFIQHAEQTRVLDNGQWTLVEADVPSRFETLWGATDCHAGLKPI